MTKDQPTNAIHKFGSYISVWEASLQTSISRKVIDEIVRDKKISASAIGRRAYLIRLDSFVEYLRWRYFPRKNVDERNKKVREFINLYKSELKNAKGERLN